MAVPFSNTHLRLPRGFANLLEGLAREVLREQPEEIPAFAAKYFADLLKKREKTMFDPAEWGAKLEDRFYNNQAFQKTASLKDELKELSGENTLVMESELDEQDLCGTGIKEAEDKAAIKIQKTYRGYRARKEVKRLKEEGR
ncbi:PREDICTED: sperm surface protein Sp17 [Crocodylus porosus]|uniref:Sperm surface protein Sp17 n=1 Tax=Crocodylus porosus TaxID=8502 RepID=A0A7M4DX44_CROPO|nr:PREDICTED: sperm surface protein Sp17 [Crocodylus porosus]